MIVRSNDMEKLKNFVLSQEFIGTLLVVVFSIVIFYIIKESALKYINKKRRKATSNQKKGLTLLYLFLSIFKYVIFLIDIIIILGIFGINVTGFLAGLGLFGVVIGLALQDLLKDFISGIFIILDNEYSVGDYVNINGFRGEVIGVGLKSTKVRDYGGDIKIISNRNISEVINLSQQNSKAVVTFTFSSDENLLNLEKAIDEVVKRLNGNLKDAIGNVQYKGVEEYKDSKITLKLTVDVKATKHYSTENEILREAKLVFDELGIKIK